MQDELQAALAAQLDRIIAVGLELHHGAGAIGNPLVEDADQRLAGHQDGVFAIPAARPLRVVEIEAVVARLGNADDAMLVLQRHGLARIEPGIGRVVP